MKWITLAFLAISFECFCQTPVLDSLQDSIGAEYYRRNYFKALELSKELLRETKRTYGDTAIFQRSNSLIKIATLHRNLGNYDSAVFIYQKTLADLHSQNLVDGMINLKILNGLFSAHFEYGRYDDARNALPALTDLVDKRLSREQKVGYVIPSNLGAYYREAGEYQKAKRYLNMSLDLVKKDSSGRAVQEYPICEAQLALLYQNLGDYKKAITHLEHALEYSVELKGKGHPDVAALTYNIGCVYHLIGRHGMALSLFRRAKRMVFDNPNITEFVKYNYANAQALGQMYLGHYDSSFASYVHLIHDVERSLGKQHIVYISTLGNLGAAYSLVGSHQKSIAILKEALELIEQGIGEESPTYQRLLNNLALQYQRLGAYEQALGIFLSIKESLVEDSISLISEEYLMLSLNMGDIYLKQGRFQQALETYLEAEQILSTDSQAHYVIRSAVQNGIGLVFYKQGNFEAALPRYQKAIEIIKESSPGMSDYYIVNLLNLSTLNLSMGEVDKASESAWKMFNTSQARLNNTFFHLTENEKAAYLKKFRYTRDIMYSLEIEKNSNHVFRATSPFKALVLSQSNLLVNHFRTDGDSALQRDFTEWISLKSRINTQLSKPISQRSAALDSLITQAELLEGALARSSKEFAEFQTSFGFEMNDLQLSLRSNSAYVDIVAYRYWNKGWKDTVRYRAYIVLPGDTNIKVVDLGTHYDFSTKAIRHKAYRNVRGLNILRKARVNSKNLSQALHRLTPYLKDIDTLYFSSSGIFNQVNVAALPLPDGGRLWDHYHVEIKSSVRELLNDESKEVTNKDLVLFGGLRYDDEFPPANDSFDCFNFTKEVLDAIPIHEKHGNDVNGVWASLDWTNKEVKEIEYISTQSGLPTQTYTDTSGSEAAFKALDGQSSYVLHLATHGYFFENPELQKDNFSPSNGFGTPFRLTEDPMMRSGLILSGANRAWQHGCNPYQPEDGILTAREISHMDLSQTELVVLSACQTGLGDIDNSEGVYGLQRAFKMAGVNYIIMSLWSVPDQETSELMIAFYRNWLEKEMPLSEAFYTAQKKMAADYPKKPELWAGFVLMQ